MKRLWSLLIPLSVLLLAAAINILDPGWLQMTRLRVFDLLEAEFPRPYIAAPVKIVDIDDESLSKLGQWPWPRHMMAEMIQRLTDGGTAAIALDIVFSEPDRMSPARFFENGKPEWKPLAAGAADFDKEFTESIAQSNVASGFVLTGAGAAAPQAKAGFAAVGGDPVTTLRPYPGAVISLAPMTEASKGNGALNSLTDPDGIIRRMPLVFRYKDQLVPGLTAEALRIAQGAGSYAVKMEGGAISGVKIGHYIIPTDSDSALYLHYTPYTAARYIPAWKLLSGAVDAKQLEGAIVLIGTSAAGLKDIRATPLNPLTSGVEVHAQAIEQVLLGDYLKRPGWMRGAELSAMLAAGMLLLLLMQRATALTGAFFAAICLGAAGAFSVFAFTHLKLLVDPLTPSVAILLVYLVESVRRYASTEKEKRQIRHAFSHYMSPALVEQLAAHPESLKLGGEMRDMSILFCDIRGFTAISERYDAEELTRFINRFLTPMTDIILSRQGTIDKYMGDCIMAFWNAPLDDAQHAEHAVHAALAMLDGLKALNAERRAEAERDGTDFLPVEIGIGINTGRCCVGNMGSDQRFDYSVLGDDVNLASRLEGQSKSYGVTTVLGPRTYEAAKEMAVIELDIIRVKGKSTAVRIHGLLGDESMAKSPDFIKLSSAILQMLGAYRTQQWKEAKQQMTVAEEAARVIDNLKLSPFFALYADRIAAYEADPPPADWDGVFTATSK